MRSAYTRREWRSKFLVTQSDRNYSKQNKLPNIIKEVFTVDTGVCTETESDSSYKAYPDVNSHDVSCRIPCTKEEEGQKLPLPSTTCSDPNDIRTCKIEWREDRPSLFLSAPNAEGACTQMSDGEYYYHFTIDLY